MLTHQETDVSPGHVRSTSVVTGMKKWESVCTGLSHAVAMICALLNGPEPLEEESLPTLLANQAGYPAAWRACAHQQAAVVP